MVAVVVIGLVYCVVTGFDVIAPRHYHGVSISFHKSAKDSPTFHCRLCLALPIDGKCLPVVKRLNGVSEHLPVDFDVVDVLYHGLDP
jgi:hypothetical protein